MSRLGKRNGDFLIADRRRVINEQTEVRINAQNRERKPERISIKNFDHIKWLEFKADEWVRYLCSCSWASQEAEDSSVS